MAFVIPFLGAVGAGATGTGIAAASFIGPLTAVQSVGTAIGGSLLSGIGVASTVLGTLQSSQAASATQERNAQLAQIDQQTKLRDAELSRRSSEAQAGDIRDDTRRRLASIRSIQTKSGVVTSEGSPLLVQQEQFAEGELEARKALFRGELSGQSSRAQASVAGLRASSLRGQAGSTRQAGITSAGTSLLTGTRSLLS